MTRRRAGMSVGDQGENAIPEIEAGSSGVWYATLIGAVLVIATGLYAAHLHQQVQEWRRAADQLRIGQSLLRGDRDEILAKTREREVSLSTLEAAREQDIARLDVLESQRQRLQAEVLRLTEILAANEQRSTASTADDDDRAAALKGLQRERDRLARGLDRSRTDIARLEDVVADNEGEIERSWAEIDLLLAGKLELEIAVAASLADSERLVQELAERQRGERLSQIVRGHRASLGEVRPYVAEVGPEDWRVIEDWLAQQLLRPMAVPDLSAHGWAYEGARLLGTIEGAPMVMLLYADQADRPASLTIAMDQRGPRALETGEQGGLDIVDWREERHAFYLAGQAGVIELERVAADFESQPPALIEDAPVPTSRYVRPRLRPANGL